MSSRSSKKTSSERLGVAGEAPAAPTVDVGRILGPHGVRGETAVESFSDVPDRFAPGRRLRLVPRSGSPRRVTVASVRPHRGTLLVRFDGIDDRDEAELLRGARLEVGRDEVPEPPEGTFYFFQLIGCRVHDVREGDLGEVIDVLEDGGGLLLVVARGERELLIPFVREMVRRVVPVGTAEEETGTAAETGADAPERSVGDGLIEIELPEGFLEACASRS